MNATVTLPISELDGLRDDLKSNKQIVQELEKTQKQVKLIIVRRDPYGINTYSDYNEKGTQWNKYAKVEQKDTVVSASYENLQEIEAILYEQALEKVDSLLQAHKNTIEAYKKRKQKQYEELDEVIKKKDKEIAILKGEKVDETKDEEIKNLVKENKTLVDDIIQLKKEYRIAAEQVKFLMNRNWFQRLFNYG